MLIGISVIELWLIAIVITGGRAVCEHVYNPIPIMENGDKRFCEVTQFKTRTIFNIK